MRSLGLLARHLLIVTTGSVLDALWIDNATFMSCAVDKKVQLCRIGDANPVRTFTGHEDEVNLIRLSKDQSTLASVSDDRTIRIWDMSMAQTQPIIPVGGTDPAQKCVLRGHVREVCSLGWCPNEGGPQHMLVT